jgi:hypothetical protein
MREALKGKRLAELEHAEIVGGNFLRISCVGDHDCGGWLGIPFKPGINGAPDGEPLRPAGYVWKREAGETLEDLTLSPSVNADACGHFFVRSGRVTL